MGTTKLLQKRIPGQNLMHDSPSAVIRPKRAGDDIAIPLGESPGAAFLVVSWAKTTFTDRRHLLFSNALSQAHHLFYPTWTVRRLTSGLISGKQALMLLDIRSLPRATFSRMSSSKRSVIP